MSSGPTNAEKMRSLPYVMTFDAFNSTFCQLSVFGSVFTLFMLELGLPAHKILMVMSLPPFFSVGAILMAPIAARIGVKRVFVGFWAARNFFVGGLLAAPWVNWTYGPDAVFWFIIAMMAMFSLCRAFGDSANMQWRQEIIPPAIRGRFAAIDNIILTLAGVAALFVAGLVISSSTSIWRYVWIMGAGTLIGLTSVLFASMIPGGGEVLKRPKPLSFHVRRFGKVIRDRNFVLYLTALSLVTFGSAPLSVFVPLYLKGQLRLEPSTIVLLGNGALMGTLLSSYLWGWAADRFGSKPVILSGLCLLLLPPLGWLLIPADTPWNIPIALGIFVIAGAASIGYGVGTWRQLYVTIVPVRRKTHYMSIYCAWIGAAGGLGQLLASQTMDLAKNLSGTVLGVPVSPYTCVFLFSILMLIVGLLLQQRVQADGSIPASRFVGMFLQGNPLVAAEGLFRYGRAGRDIDRVRIIRRLGKAKSPLSADELAEALEDPSFSVRYEAILAIARSRPSARLTGELIETLMSGPPELSIEAAWALGRIGEPVAVAPLRWTFSSGSVLLQLRSARALAILGDTEIIPELARRTDTEPDLAIRRAYVSTLQSLRKDAAARAADRARMLQDLRRRPNVNRLLAALADPDFQVKYEAIILTSHRLPEANLSRALVRILEDGEPDLSIEAARALGRMGDAAAVEPLLRAFASGHPLLRACSARALAALGEAKIAGELVRRLTDPAEPGLAIAYASALGELRIGHAAGEICRLQHSTPHRGWTRETYLALARMIDERAYIQLWRKMRKEPGTNAARFLHKAIKLTRRAPAAGGKCVFPAESMARRAALEQSALSFSRDDLTEGGRQLAQVLDALAAGAADRALAEITRHCALSLRDNAVAAAECLPLALICLRTGLLQRRA